MFAPREDDDELPSTPMAARSLSARPAATPPAFSHEMRHGNAKYGTMVHHCSTIR